MYVMGQIVSPQNSYAEVLTPSTNGMQPYLEIRSWKR